MALSLFRVSGGLDWHCAGGRGKPGRLAVCVRWHGQRRFGMLNRRCAADRCLRAVFYGIGGWLPMGALLAAGIGSPMLWPTPAIVGEERAATRRSSNTARPARGADRLGVTGCAVHPDPSRRGSGRRTASIWFDPRYAISRSRQLELAGACVAAAVDVPLDRRGACVPLPKSAVCGAAGDRDCHWGQRRRANWQAMWTARSNLLSRSRCGWRGPGQIPKSASPIASRQARDIIEHKASWPRSGRRSAARSTRIHVRVAMIRATMPNTEFLNSGSPRVRDLHQQRLPGPAAHASAHGRKRRRDSAR